MVLSNTNSCRSDFNSLTVMNKSILLALGLLAFVWFSCTPEVTGIIKPIVKLVERTVRHVAKPLKPLVKPVLNIVGIKKVRRKKVHFVQEVKHKKVVFTKDSYRLENIKPCPDGNHDIVKAKEPVTFQFEDEKITTPYRYCKKCGESFFDFDKPREDL